MAGSRSVASLLAEIAGSGPALPSPFVKEPSVQRDEPTAPSGVSVVPALTVGVEARACPDCGKLVAYPQRYGNHHHRRCGKWSDKDVGGTPVATGSGAGVVKLEASPVTEAVQEGLESPAPDRLEIARRALAGLTKEAN